jgi:hypothetical protein
MGKVARSLAFVLCFALAVSADGAAYLQVGGASTKTLNREKVEVGLTISILHCLIP